MFVVSGFSVVIGAEKIIFLSLVFPAEDVMVVEDFVVCGGLVAAVGDDVDDEVAKGISDDGGGEDGAAVTVDDVVCDVATVFAVVEASVVGVCVDDVAAAVPAVVADDVVALGVDDVVGGCVGVVTSVVVGFVVGGCVGVVTSVAVGFVVGGCVGVVTSLVDGSVIGGGIGVVFSVVDGCVVGGGVDETAGVFISPIVHKSIILWHKTKILAMTPVKIANNFNLLFPMITPLWHSSFCSGQSGGFTINISHFVPRVVVRSPMLTNYFQRSLRYRWDRCNQWRRLLTQEQ